MNIELVERLFELAEDVALDLGALNIQRGRDHALPFYNDWREYCNLTRASTFDDLAEEISNAEVRQRLQSVYGTTENIDAFVGMILEDVTPDSRLGPTLACIIAGQFRRVRDNDRFWYENPGVFEPAQLTEIRQTSLAMIICENTDGIGTVPKDVFVNTAVADFVPCSEIPRLDLTAWKECCESCADEDDGTTLSSHVRRQRRSAQSSAEGGTHSKGGRKNRKKQKRQRHIPVSVRERHKVFLDLAWTKSLNATSNPEEILDISKTILTQDSDGIERVLKVVARDELDTADAADTSDNAVPSQQLDGTEMAKLLSVIQKLESKVESLQDEVQRLGGQMEK